MLILILSLLFLQAAPPPAIGSLDGEGLAPTDVERITVGGIAPDFRLVDETGTPYRLSDYRGRKNVILVFYRGHWCRQCAAQFGKLKDLLDADARRTNQILAVSPDDHGGGRKMVERVASESGAPPRFPLLADPEFNVINRYEVFNPNLFNGHKVPYPSVFVIDRAGTVRWKYLDAAKQTRPENVDILKALAELHGQ